MQINPSCDHTGTLSTSTRRRLAATLARLKYPIDSNLVLAIIWQESGGDPAAWNPEPRYRWLWDVKQDRPFRQLTAAEIESESRVSPAIVIRNGGRSRQAAA